LKLRDGQSLETPDAIGSRPRNNFFFKRAGRDFNESKSLENEIEYSIPVIIGRRSCINRSSRQLRKYSGSNLIKVTYQDAIISGTAIHPVNNDTACGRTLPTIYLLNPTSLAKPHAIQQLTTDVQSYDADTVVISESWLKQRHSNEAFSIPGFDIFRRDRPRRRGGGVTIYIRSTLGASVCHSLLFTDDMIELLWIQLTFRGRKMVIGALYHPPKPLYKHYKEAELISELERVTEIILTEPNDTLDILAGDFNQLSDNVLTQLGFVSVFQGATHQGHSLDRIYATEALQYQLRAITSSISTNHKAVIACAGNYVLVDQSQ